MERMFSGWADIVATRTCYVFWISLVIFIALSSGMTQSKLYEDENVIWTPSGNPTLKAQDKSKALFETEEKYRAVSLIWEIKGDATNILNVEALKEMKQFEDLMYSVTDWRDTYTDASNNIIRPKKEATYNFEDICYQVDESYPRLETAEVKNLAGVITQPAVYSQQIRKKCFGGSYNKPLDFLYNLETGTYDFTGVTDVNFMAAVNSGKGDPRIFKGNKIINMQDMAGNPTPAAFTQDVTDGSPTIGVNNLESTKLIRYNYVIRNSRNQDMEEETYQGWEDTLHEKFDEWKLGLKHTTPHLQTIQGFIVAIVEDINHDFGLIFGAIIFVGFYTFLFLGNFSPMHCRCLVALCGLVCVLFAYTSGFGLLYYCQMKTTGVHQLMPFLLIGIGVDDMFVLCNSVDQTDLKKSAYERLHEAIGHSGPAITITSLTNCLAFFFGALNSLEALSSFCLFAAVSILMLYFLALTVFVSVVYWDTKRVEKKQNECCGGCFCSQTSVICCRSSCASPKQQAHAGIEWTAAKKASMKAAEEKSDPAIKATLMAGGTERCLGKYFAPLVLHRIGKWVILAIYAVLIGLFIYGATQVEVHFEVDFFISKTSVIYTYFQLNKEWYSSAGGEVIQTYIESPNTDWTTEETQRALNVFDQKLQDMKPCGESATCEGWMQENSVTSWYKDFKQTVALGELACTTGNTAPVDEFVPTAIWQNCFSEWLLTSEGKNGESNISRTSDGQIRGWRQFVTPKKIKAVSTDGPDFLSDLTDLKDKYGLGDTYFYSAELLDYEQYVVFVRELCLSLGLSIFAVFLVVIFITGSVPITLLVLLAVLLVDVFLLGLIHFWDLTLNSIILVNLVIGLGLSVDYSAHISHTYLIVEAPKTYSVAEQRVYKAKIAISSMGSSVLHGGTSTFLAVIVLGGAKSYIFEVFFKMWFGIIVFGMANGFILLPVILSIIGPTPNPEIKKTEKVEMVRRMSTMKRMSNAQLEAMKASAGIVEDDDKEVSSESEKDAEKGEKIAAQ